MEQELSSRMKTVWAVLLGLESFLIISGNIMAIPVFLKKRFRISKPLYLIANLTVADIFVGVSAVFALLEVLHSSDTMSREFKLTINNIKISPCVFIFTVLVSLLSLVLMAVERALAILIPFRFRRVQLKHYLGCIAIVWCISLLNGILRYITSFEGIENFRVTLLGFFFFSSIFIITLSYVAVFVKAKFFSPLQTTNASMRNNMKLAKTSLLTTLIAMITWLPGTVVHALYTSTPANVSPDIRIGLTMLVFSNSFANLLIYWVRVPRFRNEIKKMLRLKSTRAVNLAQVDSTLIRNRGFVIPLPLTVSKPTDKQHVEQP